MPVLTSDCANLVSGINFTYHDIHALAKRPYILGYRPADENVPELRSIDLTIKSTLLRQLAISIGNRWPV